MSKRRQPPDDQTHRAWDPRSDALQARAALAFAGWLTPTDGGYERPCECTGADHQKLDTEQRARVDPVLSDLEDLARNRRQQPRHPVLLPPGDLTWPRIENVWRYFLWLKSTFGHRDRAFRDSVHIYVRAHDAVWEKLPCTRGGFPLLHPPDAGLPQPSETQRLGGKRGPRPDPRVADLDARIRSLSSDNLVACQQLDERGEPIPEAWRHVLPPAEQTWVGAYLDPRTNRRVRERLRRARRRTN